ncbi:MAG: RNA polymerase subunit sigma [Firmicutes bacterium]|nr:RNA polymerase subunit sigma [Bacillota bacterium]
MEDIDGNAVRAQSDRAYCDSFISKFEPFILQTAHKVTGRFITKSDDQWSVSLLAFHEAIKSYSSDKGMFIPFARLVIQRRLHDYLKGQSKYYPETAVNPIYFGNDVIKEQNVPVNLQILRKTSITPDDSANLEIQALATTLEEYGFSFFDLINASPKAKKTRAVCAKAVLYLLRNQDQLNKLRESKMLPLKEIQKGLTIPRKLLERHRKFIITAVEILDGSYPILSEYLKFIEEGQ